MQLKDEDFKDFEGCAKKLAFDKIPFSKVASLKFTQNLTKVGYKLSHAEEFRKETLKDVMAKVMRRRNGKFEPNNTSQSIIMTLKPKILPFKNTLSTEKIKALKKNDV